MRSNMNILSLNVWNDCRLIGTYYILRSVWSVFNFPWWLKTEVSTPPVVCCKIYPPKALNPGYTSKRGCLINAVSCLLQWPLLRTLLCIDNGYTVKCKCHLIDLDLLNSDTLVAVKVKLLWSNNFDGMRKEVAVYYRLGFWCLLSLCNCV